MVQQGGDERIHRVKADVARRLRYVRRHHAEGPFTLAGLAERAGASQRALSHAEPADRLSGLIGEILASAAQAQSALRDLPAPPRGRPGHDDERR